MQFSPEEEEIRKQRNLKYKCNKFPVCIVATCIDVVGEWIVKRKGIVTIS